MVQAETTAQRSPFLVENPYRARSVRPHRPLPRSPGPRGHRRTITAGTHQGFAVCLHERATPWLSGSSHHVGSAPSGPPHGRWAGSTAARNPCGSGRAAGTTPRRTPAPGRTASHNHSPGTRWPPTETTGGPTPPHKSPGASATSRTATRIRAGLGPIPSPTTGINRTLPRQQPSLGKGNRATQPHVAA